MMLGSSQASNALMTAGVVGLELPAATATASDSGTAAARPATAIAISERQNRFTEIIAMMVFPFADASGLLCHTDSPGAPIARHPPVAAQNSDCP
jgi:hypothetical protein